MRSLSILHADLEVGSCLPELCAVGVCFSSSTAEAALLCCTLLTKCRRMPSQSVRRKSCKALRDAVLSGLEICK